MNQPQQPRELKKIPNNATKTQVFNWYNLISTLKVRRVIRYAIEEVNKGKPKDLQDSYRIYRLTQHHIKIIVDELGTPPGFKDL